MGAREQTIGTARSITAGATAAILWLAVIGLAGIAAPAAPLGWLLRVLTPGMVGEVARVPSPWGLVAVVESAVLVGVLTAGVAISLRGISRVVGVWLGMALASFVAGAVMGIGVIAADLPTLGFSFPAADVAGALGSQAWGLLLGWIPALVAGWSTEAATRRTALRLGAGIFAVVLAVALGVAAGGAERGRFATPVQPAPTIHAPSGPPSAPPDTPSAADPDTSTPTPDAQAPVIHYDLARTTCAPGALVLASHSGDAATGHRALVFELQNTGGAACTVTGYPAVGFRDADGMAVEAGVTPGASFMATDPGPAEITLAPGATATAVIGWDAGAEPDDPTTTHEVRVQLAAGVQPVAFAQILDIVKGTAVEVTAWHLGSASGD